MHRFNPPKPGHQGTDSAGGANRKGLVLSGVLSSAQGAAGIREVIAS